MTLTQPTRKELQAELQQVEERLEGLPTKSGEWQCDGTTVYALNEEGSNHFFAQFQGPQATPLELIRSADLAAHSPAIHRAYAASLKRELALLEQLEAR